MCSNQTVKAKLRLALKGIPFPDTNLPDEPAFNRDGLLAAVKRAPDFLSLSPNPQRDCRRRDAVPFFGASAKKDNQSVIDGRSKTDLVFSWSGTRMFIENKIIRSGRECDIKNALVQVVEYLNLYDVPVAALLIFDEGRGSDREWQQGTAEHTVIACLTERYPFCVARLRRGKDTFVY